MARLSITDKVHQFLSAEIHPGDHVIDATMGNGHDTLFLSKQVGDQGHVFAFDIQPGAIQNTRDQLALQQLQNRATLLLKSHASMHDFIPIHQHGHITCVIFNLGYLPGADKSLTTQIESTLSALTQSCRPLTKQGCISILAYTGHPGGMEEFDAIKNWVSQLSNNEFTVSINNLLPNHRHPPQWVLIKKRA